MASGFDWNDFIDQMIEAERIPETTLRARQATINQQNSAFTSIKTKLAALQTAVDALKDPALYDRRTGQSSDAAAGTASASAGAALGTYVFNFTRLASAAKINGAANIGRPLSASSDVSGLTLATAGFATTITSGTFTVNGRQVTIATTDTLQQVFDKIADATDDNVTGAYDPVTDRITLAAADHSEIILGSATDTSNFLQAARLHNNGTETTTSALALGSVRLSATLASASFATAVSDGGSGAGEFKINGVSIAFNAGTDTVNDVISRINNSAAGATASYDTVNDRLVLTSKATGDIGIAIEEVTGNFLAATGLAGGALERGNDLAYTVNGGAELTSRSNTVTADSSGIAGLSVTALKTATPVTVSVASDTDGIKGAIQSFVDAYNAVQSFIDSQTDSSTGSDGKVTAGLLANDTSARDISSGLRQTIFQSLSSLSATVDHLADLGIQTNGYNNTLEISDSSALDGALTSRLEGVKEFFSDATGGLAVLLDGYLDRTIDDTDGTLIAHQAALTKAASGIDEQIAAMEKVILAHKNQMTSAFVAMESAQARINQQLQYLNQMLQS
jgi:flagellar hook-associated protein 2